LLQEPSSLDYPRKPSWLKKNIAFGPVFQNVRDVLDLNRLHTVCEEAICPNRGDCFSQGTATFLILGNRCTRDCHFCGISTGPLEQPDPTEPRRVAEAVKKLGLEYVVITSVTRDDLSDGGAKHFAEVINSVRIKSPETIIETLIPDFRGDESAVRSVLAAHPDVLSHNIEITPRLYPQIRPGSDYRRSLAVLRRAGELDGSIVSKSGLMLGLGETRAELCEVFSDLNSIGCSILTLGQYLQPDRSRCPVIRFIPPREFAELRDIAFSTGIREVAASPFVRSSYHAIKMYTALKNLKKT
jgi:lipoyl synthase